MKQYHDDEFARAQVAECLRLVNLAPETTEKYPAQLSEACGKESGIARAIAGAPSICSTTSRPRASIR